MSRSEVEFLSFSFVNNCHSATQKIMLQILNLDLNILEFLSLIFMKVVLNMKVLNISYFFLLLDLDGKFC